MTSEQLLKFKAIAESRTMTEAAESLFITQSALSHSLSALEEELQCKLFVRDKKKLILTPPGENLLKYANTISDLLERATVAIRDDKSISISAVNVCASSLIRNLSDEDLSNVKLLRMEESDIPEKLMNGSLDIGTCDDYYINEYYTKYPDAPRLDRIMICREQLVLVVPKGHRLYKKKSVTYMDLLNEPLCMRLEFDDLLDWLKRIEKMTMNGGQIFKIDFMMDFFTYRFSRDSIKMPELRNNNSIFNADLDRIDLEQYRVVPIKDLYSSRYIYMWYLESSAKKIEIIKKSLIQYYETSRIDMS